MQNMFLYTDLDIQEMNIVNNLYFQLVSSVSIVVFPPVSKGYLYNKNEKMRVKKIRSKQNVVSEALISNNQSRCRSSVHSRIMYVL